MLQIQILKLRPLFILFITVTSGCTSIYSHTDLLIPSVKLDPSLGVLISVPDDGWYGKIRYRNSGQMTATAVRSAFAKHALKVDITSNCHGEDCLSSIDILKYGYYIMPLILHWEDRATEWSALPDRIEIQLIVYDAVTQIQLANIQFSGMSKLTTFGGDHPQDLLSEPTNEYVDRLYNQAGANEQL